VVSVLHFHTDFILSHLPEVSNIFFRLLFFCIERGIAPLNKLLFYITIH
jgi:hypothetical protein